VVEFLSRDFSDPRSQAAAEKNAYKLVQQRRYHLALAFFILARQIREVCDLCCRQLQDVQLALFLCRLTDATQRPCGPPLGADSFSSASAFPPPTDASSRQSPSSLTSAGAGCAPSSPGSLPVACGTLCPSASPPPLSSPTLGAESPGGALSPSSVTSSPAAEYRRVLILRLAPLAAAAGDVWLLHLAFWLAGDHGAAFFVLLPPHLPPASFSRLAPLTQPHAQIATCCPTEGGRRANSRGCASPDHTWNWRSEHSDLSTLTPFDPRPFFFSPHSSRASCLSPSLSSLVSASGSARASLITHAEAGLSRRQGAPTGFFSWAGTDASDTASLHEDADRFDGGALRHSALSLSLVAFRSVVQNALPIQRLRVQLEEQHTQLQLARELHAQLRAQSPLARALGSAQRLHPRGLLRHDAWGLRGRGWGSGAPGRERLGGLRR
ncbi:RAVE 1 carboxy-terminal protein, partial [Toxoplasma gondii MAS]